MFYYLSNSMSINFGHNKHNKNDIFALITTKRKNLSQILDKNGII